jgi:hypothetical protein
MPRAVHDAFARRAAFFGAIEQSRPRPTEPGAAVERFGERGPRGDRLRAQIPAIRRSKGLAQNAVPQRTAAFRSAQPGPEATARNSARGKLSQSRWRTPFPRRPHPA